MERQQIIEIVQGLLGEPPRFKQDMDREKAFDAYIMWCGKRQLAESIEQALTMTQVKR